MIITNHYKIRLMGPGDFSFASLLLRCLSHTVPVMYGVRGPWCVSRGKDLRLGAGRQRVLTAISSDSGNSILNSIILCYLADFTTKTGLIRTLAHGKRQCGLMVRQALINCTFHALRSCMIWNSQVFPRIEFTRYILYGSHCFAEFPLMM